MKHQTEGEDALRPHQYDGIQEYDNQLPTWWVGMFVLSILFSMGYLYWYEYTPFGDNLKQSFETELQKEERLKRERMAKEPEVSEESLLALLTNEETLKRGRAHFETKCATCHGNEGEGLVGPNLTDSYFLHGNKISQMLLVVRDGVLAKGMPPWGALMNRDEMKDVAVYVKSLHGKTVKNPKKPEGDLIP